MKWFWAKFSIFIKFKYFRALQLQRRRWKSHSWDSQHFWHSHHSLNCHYHSNHLNLLALKRSLLTFSTFLIFSPFQKLLTFPTFRNSPTIPIIAIMSFCLSWHSQYYWHSRHSEIPHLMSLCIYWYSQHSWHSWNSQHPPIPETPVNLPKKIV